MEGNNKMASMLAFGRYKGCKKKGDRHTQKLFIKSGNSPRFFRFLSGDKASSPLMGLIMIVAVTVIMGFIIMNWSQHLTTPVRPEQVSLSIKRDDTYNGTITIIRFDPPGSSISNITIMNETRVLTAPGESLESFGMETNSPNGDVVGVGDTRTAEIFGKQGEYINVVVQFGSGKEQMVLNAKF